MDENDLYYLQRRQQALTKAEEMLFEKENICNELFEYLQIALDGNYDTEKSVEQNFLHASVSIARDDHSKDIITQMQTAWKIAV